MGQPRARSARVVAAVVGLAALVAVAGACDAITSVVVSGASFGGALGVTTTSGPGLALKAETVGLAVALELPLLVIDVQRGGPSTGLPTKTEQADLLQAMYGRNGEAPVPIIAPASPSECFDAAIQAARIALTYRTPVFLLSDGAIANGSEPWNVPDVDSLPDLSVEFATEANAPDGSGEFWPYLRDDDTLAPSGDQLAAVAGGLGAVPPHLDGGTRPVLADPALLGDDEPDEQTLREEGAP